jgi:tRNA A58 N-methylase Trm61
MIKRRCNHNNTHTNKNGISIPPPPKEHTHTHTHIIWFGLIIGHHKPQAIHTKEGRKGMIPISLILTCETHFLEKP